MPTHETASGWRDVLDGFVGAGGMVLNLLTPFLRGVRSHWGLERALAERDHPGDELVAHPKWGWTHAIEVDAKAQDVWGWLAQVGADRAGFYSYQWLENLVGCELRNASQIHPEWEHRLGDELILHPDMPGLKVVDLERNRYFVALGDPAADPSTATAGNAEGVRFSWLFLLEPVLAGGTRVISRVRSDYPDGLSSAVKYGPYLTESIGFVMDRRMLLGIKARAERDTEHG
jgi:hypothetical protein